MLLILPLPTLGDVVAVWQKTRPFFVVDVDLSRAFSDTLLT